jgi:hypothetical protein
MTALQFVQLFLSRISQGPEVTTREVSCRRGGRAAEALQHSLYVAASQQQHLITLT